MQYESFLFRGGRKIPFKLILGGIGNDSERCSGGIIKPDVLHPDATTRPHQPDNFTPSKFVVRVRKKRAIRRAGNCVIQSMQIGARQVQFTKTLVYFAQCCWLLARISCFTRSALRCPCSIKSSDSAFMNPGTPSERSKSRDRRRSALVWATSCRISLTRGVDGRRENRASLTAISLSSCRAVRLRSDTS